MPAPAEEQVDDFRSDIEAVVKDLGTTTTEAEPIGPARDATGRFAPRTEATNEVLADVEQAPKALTPPAPQPPEGAAQAPAAQAPAAQAPAERAPVSWSPEERQAWEQVPAGARAAIVRREQEINRALSQTADQRRFASEVQQVLQPYMPLIQAEQSTPIRAIEEVMRTAALLRTGAPQQKAIAVAQLVQQYGINVEQLDAALASVVQGRQPAQDPYAHMIQQQLAPVQKFMEQMQQMQAQSQQRIVQEAEQTLEQFLADPANEFANDVCEDMADILEMAANRGKQMSLQDAYARATMLHPEVSKIVQGRQTQQRAAQQTAAAQQARSAAVSVGGTGAPSVSSGIDEGGDDVRSAIGAALRQLSNSR